MRAFWVLASFSVLLLGCVDSFSGSWIQFDLTGVKSPCSIIMEKKLPAPKPCTGDPLQDRFLYHYELWATVNRSASVYLASFTVQNHLFTDEQIKLEKDRKLLSDGKQFLIGEDKAYNEGYCAGQPSCQEMTKTEREETYKRMKQAEEAWAIVGYSTEQFKPGTNNTMLHPDFYLGSYKQLTRPRNGTYYGQVHSRHPYGASTLGGASITVAPVLDKADSLWLTIESAAPNRPSPVPSDIVILRGSTRRAARDIINCDATSNLDSTLLATFSVQTRLGEEEYF